MTNFGTIGHDKSQQRFMIFPEFRASAAELPTFFLVVPSIKFGGAI
jgi:hypothetical protein